MEEVATAQEPITEMALESTCPFCHVKVAPDQYFCQNCGKKLHEPPPSVMRQLYIYTVSIILPPSGLWYGIKYLPNKSGKVRAVGWIALVLTLTSLAISIIISVKLVDYYTKQFNEQMQQYQNIGL